MFVGLGGFNDMFGHVQKLNNMMGSIFGNDPFMNGENHVVSGQRSQSMSMMPFDTHNAMFSPFGFPNVNQMMQSMSQIPNNPNCHSFSSSSVIEMTTGPDGKPQIYRSSESTRAGPGGVRETKKSVSDSRTGVKKLAIGRHIGERGHVKEREQNVYTGHLEENDEYINLEEEQEPEFSREWQEKTRQSRSRKANHTISYPSRNSRQYEHLALPPPSSSRVEDDDEKLSNERENAVCLKAESQSKKKNHRSQPYSKRKEKKEKSQE